MGKEAYSFSKPETGATNGSAKKYIPCVWKGFKCTVVIKHSDFEAVYLTAYLYSKHNFWSIPIRHQIYRLPKLYHRDRTAGRVQAFRAYRQHAHEIPTKDRKIDFQYHLLHPAVKKFLSECSDEEIESLERLVTLECIQLIKKLNIGIVDAVQYVIQNGVGLLDNGKLTGWMTLSNGEWCFSGIRKRRLFQDYLGEPFFLPKQLENGKFYQGEVGRHANYFCKIWKNNPSILPIVAYGVLALMHTPPKPESRDGRFPLDFSARQPSALVVTGCRRDSLAALRAFADTNFNPTEPRQRESWLDSILQDGNFFESYAKKGLFQNATLFQNNSAEQLELGSAKRWEEIREYGLHPVVWMPNLKRTCCTKEQMKKILRVQVRKESRLIFQEYTFREAANLWRIILRLYIRHLENLEKEDFKACSIRFDSCNNWLREVALDDDDKAFLQANAEHKSVAFAFGQLLRCFETEHFIDRDDSWHLLNLLVQELRICEKLFNESELDRLRRYFKPMMAGEDPVGRKKKTSYLFWNGEEQRTKEPCFYIEANRWEEDYRKQTNSEASNTQLMHWLKPYLIQRPDKKALGMQRAYRDPNSGMSKKVYVLCIQKNRFLCDK